MKKQLITLLLLISTSFLFGQKTQKLGKISGEITESSGLIFYNDTLLITHNDSGDKPMLYFINLKGKLVHQVLVQNAKNVDWEDITKDDKGNFYIADIGNNSNQRKDLKIYKIKGENLLKVNTILAEAIEIVYAEQTDFPPKDEELHFDAEGIAFQNDSIWILTKCRAVPFDGIAYVYKVPTKSGVYKLKRKTQLFIGKHGFMQDAVTAIDIYKDKLYVLTYDKILIYSIDNQRLTFENQYFLKPYSQKEALVVKNNREIYLTDESTKILGGGYLYKLTIDATKIKH